MERAWEKVQQLKRRFDGLVQQYGRVALWVYFSIFGLVLGGFYLAINSGYRPDGTANVVGTLGAAWLATKLTQPIRLLATLGLTPVIARWTQRDASAAEGR